MKHIDFEVAGFGELGHGPTLQRGYVNMMSLSGPVAWWRLGDTPGSVTALEESGGYTGVYMGTVVCGEPGVLSYDHDTAAHFTGASSHVAVSTFRDFPLTLSQGMTLNLWLKADQPSSGSMYVFGNRNAVDGTAFLAGVNMTTYGQYIRGGVRVIVSSADWKLLVGGIGEDTGLTDGHWHMLTVTVSPVDNVIGVYVDGAVQPVTYFTRQGPSVFTSLSSPLVFGAGDDRGIRRSFIGLLDEVAVFGGILSGESIVMIYRSAVE